jgi:hypothetical protein
VIEATESRRDAAVTCLIAGVTALICAAMLAAAVLAPAPPLVVPFIVVVGIGLPLMAAWDVPAAVDVLRGEARLIAQFRRELDRLPETTG